VSGPIPWWRGSIASRGRQEATKLLLDWAVLLEHSRHSINFIYLALLTPSSRPLGPSIYYWCIRLVIRRCSPPGASQGQVIINTRLIDGSLQLIIRLSSLHGHLRDLLLVHFDEILRTGLAPLGRGWRARLFRQNHFRVDHTQK
jgi:hypothetical protein